MPAFQSPPHGVIQADEADVHGTQHGINVDAFQIGHAQRTEKCHVMARRDDEEPTEHDIRISPERVELVLSAIGRLGGDLGAQPADALLRLPHPLQEMLYRALGDTPSPGVRLGRPPSLPRFVKAPLFLDENLHPDLQFAVARHGPPFFFEAFGH